MGLFVRQLHRMAGTAPSFLFFSRERGRAGRWIFCGGTTDAASICTRRVQNCLS